ncbi:MAG TPA: MurT ligase domain-containing protein, partial [Ktedonobacterales bacterium]|nr:MurT ligase domain-containing protein [Ktedonobacterales bacterium]
AERIDMAQETEDTRPDGASQGPSAATTMPAPGGPRLALALGVAKLAGSTGRMLKIGGGTSLPGMLARKIDPDVLRKVVGASKAKKLAITGSNGKTTTAHIVAAIAAANELKITQNRAGANMLQGVTTVAVNAANLRGELDDDLLVIEVDEGTFHRAIPEINPDVVIVNNVFRDQLDRYGELYKVAGNIERIVRELPASATVALNADDPLVANFVEMPARRLYFGLDAPAIGGTKPEHSADSVRCPRCQAYFEYDAVYVSHLGAYRCPNCGFARPKLDIALTAASLPPQGPTSITVRTPAGEVSLTMPLLGMHNVYNAVGALAGAYALGMDLSQAASGLANIKPVFGRLEPIKAGDQTVYLSFVKNPTSYNTMLNTVKTWPGQKHVLVAASNTPVDGEDFAWFWDVEIEDIAADLLTVTCSGLKAEELAMRFKYAGVPEEKLEIIHDRAAALDVGLRKAGPGGSLFIFAGYTPVRELRRTMADRGWVGYEWEE